MVCRLQSNRCTVLSLHLTGCRATALPLMLSCCCLVCKSVCFISNQRSISGSFCSHHHWAEWNGEKRRKDGERQSGSFEMLNKPLIVLGQLPHTKKQNLRVLMWGRGCMLHAYACRRGKSILSPGTHTRTAGGDHQPSHSHTHVEPCVC